MHIRKNITRLVTAAAVAGTCLVLADAAAMAAGGPTGSGSVAGTVTVAETMTFSLQTTSFTIAGNAGQMNAPASAPVKYSVSTNDPAGFAVTVGAASDMQGSGGATLAASDLTDASMPPGAGTPYGYSLAEPPATTTIYTADSPAGSGQFSDTWEVTLPTNAIPGAYTVTVNYLAAAN